MDASRNARGDRQRERGRATVKLNLGHKLFEELLDNCTVATKVDCLMMMMMMDKRLGNACFVSVNVTM